MCAPDVEGGMESTRNIPLDVRSLSFSVQHKGGREGTEKEESDLS